MSKHIFDDYELPVPNSWNKDNIDPIGNSVGKASDRLAKVDDLADELVKVFDNPGWRPWYCGVIKKFGSSKVHEWLVRCQEAEEPGKIFSMYVGQAGGYKRERDGKR